MRTSARKIIASLIAVFILCAVLGSVLSIPFLASSDSPETSPAAPPDSATVHPSLQSVAPAESSAGEPSPDEAARSATRTRTASPAPSDSPSASSTPAAAPVPSASAERGPMAPASRLPLADHNAKHEETAPQPAYVGLATTYEDQVRRYQSLRRVGTPTPEMGLRGMVIDESMTRFGRDFYDRFYRYWRTPPKAGFHTVRIVEEPRPGRGTLVQVKVNDDAVYQARLQPGANPVQDRPLQAARRAYAYVQSGKGTLTIY